MRKLENVYLPELIYPCIAYAFARIGKRELIPSFNLDDFKKLWMSYSKSDTIKGDILIWVGKQKEKKFRPVMIENNKLKLMKTEYGWHAGVYEGDNIVSEAVWDENDNYEGLPFVIKFEKLSALEYPPDFYVRYKG